MPSLVSMDNRTLLASFVGLCIFVITEIMNTIVKIATGVIVNSYHDGSSRSICILECACIYVAMTIALLIITISSSLSIPISKDILELKYQATKKTLSTDQQMTRMSLVELRQHVRRFWVMAEMGSPRFVMASSILSTTAGVICVVFSLIQSMVMLEYLPYNLYYKYESAYKRLMVFILWTQSLRVVVGTI